MPTVRVRIWAALSAPAVCLISVLVATSAAHAATIYVDPESKGGTCRNSHSVKQASKQSRPWCTLKYAFNKAPAGTKLDLRGGLHKAVLPTDVEGSPSKLTLTEHPGERAVLMQVRLNRCSRISFRRLTLRYVRLERCSGSSFIGNEVIAHGLWAYFSSDLRFIGNTLHDTDNGIIMGSNRGVLIERNDFRRINTKWKITNNEFTYLTQWALELNNVPRR